MYIYIPVEILTALKGERRQALLPHFCNMFIKKCFMSELGNDYNYLQGDANTEMFTLVVYRKLSGQAVRVLKEILCTVPQPLKYGG